MSDVSDSLYIVFLESVWKGRIEEYSTHEIINTIIENNLKLDFNPPNAFSFQRVHLSFYITLSFNKLNQEFFTKIVNYTEIEIYKNAKNKTEIIIESCQENSFNRKEILLYLLDNEDDLGRINLLKIYRLLLSKNNIDADFVKYFNRFLTMLHSSNKCNILVK